MDPSEENDTDSQLTELNLSHQNIELLDKAKSRDQHVISLILDNNKLGKLDNIDSYGNIEKLSVSYNSLVRMYGVSRLYTLKLLDLAENSIVAIEGLRDMVHLKYLNLSGNNIKCIEHLGTNVNLEHLDLSKNNIMKITDLSHMSKLKKLFLNNNKITSLKWCEKYLPQSLEIFNLADNRIADLAELCHLRNLTTLQEFSFHGNPCILNIPFDHRPYVINWLLCLTILDNETVTPKESLQAEWLYSQGKGRNFAPGEYLELCQYLCSVCPTKSSSQVKGDTEEEDERLMRVLNKAQQHQKELKNKVTELDDYPDPANKVQKRPLRPSSNPLRPRSKTTGISSKPGKRAGSSIFTFELPASIYGATADDLDVMTKSCQSTLPESHCESPLMTQSLDPYTLSHTLRCPSSSEMVNGDYCEPKSNQRPNSLHISQSAHQQDNLAAPLQESDSDQLFGASCFVPAPESLMSPVVRSFRAPGYSPKITKSERSLPKVAHTERVPKKRIPNSVAQTRTSTIRASSCDAPRRVTPKKQLFVENKQPVKTSPKTIPKSQVKERNRPTKKPLQKQEDSNDSSDNTDSEISVSKLENIRELAQHRRTAQSISSAPSSDHEQRQLKVYSQHDSGDSGKARISLSKREAAVIIQKYWRGFKVRKCDNQVALIYQKLRISRAEDHVRKLTSELQDTKAALEREKKLRMLQTEAIRALWREVQTFQLKSPGTPNTPRIDPNLQLGKVAPQPVLKSPDLSLTDLRQTCTLLQQQVGQLQQVLQGVVGFMQNSKVQEPSWKSICLDKSAKVDSSELSSLKTLESDRSKIRNSLSPNCFKASKNRPSSLQLNLDTPSVQFVDPNSVPDGIKKFAEYFVESLLAKVTTETALKFKK